MRRRFRRYRRVNPYVFIFFIIGIFLSYFFVTLERNLSETINTVACAKAKVMATETINQTIYDRIANEVQYRDLITVEKDNQGKIVLMQPNTIAINKLMAQTTLEVQKAMEKMEERRIRIPAVQAFDNAILANIGPKISVRIVPIGTIRTTILNKFEEAGINQTRHRILLNVEATVRVVFPLLESKAKVVTQVPIAETIIVGEVPNTYMNLTPMNLAPGLKY